MSTQVSRSRNVGVTIVGFGCLVAVVAAAYASRSSWLPLLSRAEPVGNAEKSHAPHAAAASIELSDKGLKNIGFKALEVTLSDYQRSLTLPAIVVERPGRSQIHITAPLTGIVQKIYAVSGEAVGPNEPLFDLRLTHEELVAAQRDFLQTIADLKIVESELKRLQGLGQGVVAGKRVLEQQYEKRKLEASLMADEQAMLLHGLDKEQIAAIRNSGRLFRDVTVMSPEHVDDEELCEGPHLFTIQKLEISLGAQVEAGQELAVLADHCELHVEGHAFEDDAEAIRTAAEASLPVTAQLISASQSKPQVDGLKILYIADQIDHQSRALKFYLRLPNEIALEKTAPGGKRFLEWRYKPGQRMQIRIPVETWQDQLVLPTTAIVDTGAESYVYRQNGDSFDQVAVHVLSRDQNALVIANDGALFPGDVIAGAGAYQMHLALKNQSGGAINPHAGHNH